MRGPRVRGENPKRHERLHHLHQRQALLASHLCSMRSAAPDGGRLEEHRWVATLGSTLLHLQEASEGDLDTLGFTRPLRFLEDGMGRQCDPCTFHCVFKPAALPQHAAFVSPGLVLIQQYAAHLLP